MWICVDIYSGVIKSDSFKVANDSKDLSIWWMDC